MVGRGPAYKAYRFTSYSKVCNTVSYGLPYMRFPGTTTYF